MSCSGHGVAMPPCPKGFPANTCWLCHLPFPPPYVPPPPSNCPPGFTPHAYEGGVMRSASGHIQGIQWDQLSGANAHLLRFKDVAIGPGHPLAEGMDPRCFIPSAARAPTPSPSPSPSPLPLPRPTLPPAQAAAAPPVPYALTQVDGATLVTLTLGQLSASICPGRGADLVSLTLRGVELLHRGTGGAPLGSAAQAALLAPPAQEGAWEGHGLTLFPAVGRHAGGAYAHPATGPREPLPMPLHGLALKQPFAILPPAPHAAAQPTLTCQLRDQDLTPQQRASYPFRFSLTITYSLGPQGLTVTHAVTSLEPGPSAREQRRLLPFALGNHLSLCVPDFAAARLAGSPTLEFELAPGSLLSGVAAPRSEFGGEGGCPLSAPGVLDGVFGGPPGAGGERALTLILREGGDAALPRAVTVAQRWTPPSGGSPACDWGALAEHLFFVLWGAPPGALAAGEGSAGFLCIEPWLGGPDALNGRCALLDAGETLLWEFQVSAE